MADSPPTNDPLDEAFAAYLRSCDAGEIQSREEFLAQFPDLSDELKELIEAADMIGRVTYSGSDVQPVDHPEPGAETIASHATTDNDDSGGDPAATLPMAHRAAGDPGPTLPYDLGDYMLLEVIGRGGMGVVYLAKQHELDREVAVKMIRSGMLADEAEVRRFYTEAQAAARLHHQGIVAVHQFGRRAGHHFFSMEYIRGTDLQRMINRSVLDAREAARYVRDVARAIHHAHQKGVLHRDLKPANVLIDEQYQIHVTDFGLAKHMDSDSSVTSSGAAVGTPHYMAPEQAGGLSDRASRQSDVYSLGAILFACVTGRPPIVADSVMQTLVQVVHHPAPSARSIRPGIPLDLDTIIAKCLEKKPTQRYESAEQLANELDAFLEGRPIQARPRSRVMKLWHWLEGVPLVGALSGRRVLDTSATHRRVQAAALMMLLLTPILMLSLILLWQRQRDAMPNLVRFGGGVSGGVYRGVSQELANRLEAAHDVSTQIIGSGGSLDNRDGLLAGTIDLAPVQATAISGGKLCVVAPLFYEVLYVFVNVDTNIRTLQDFPGHRVAVGPDGSGSRAIAELVLGSLGLSAITRDEGDWEKLFLDNRPDAAMVCIGQGSPLVTRLLADDRWRLVSVPDGEGISLAHPTLLQPVTIQVDEKSAMLPGSTATNRIPTVATRAFLAAHEDTPAELVVAVLEALYQSPSPIRGLISRDQTAEWQELLPLHGAARDYFLKL